MVLVQPRVRFIFLHTPHPEAQGWKEDASETVCAKNNQRQDDDRVAVRGPQPVVRGQVEGTAEPPELPRKPGSKRRCSAAVGSRLVADWCAALVDALALLSTPAASAPCRPRCGAPAWASRSADPTPSR